MTPSRTVNGLHPLASRRWLVSYGAAALWALLLVVVVAHLVVVLEGWLRSVRYPFGLDYGEGIVWQQALLIPSARMYGAITHYPYIVFHYPPVYHLAVRAIASLGVDWLVAGRSISVAAMLATGALIAALTYRAVQNGETRTAGIIGAAIAGLITFTYEPVEVYGALMRVDPLAVALSFLGVYCAVRSLERPWLLYAAVGSFVLAIFTKQTAIAAPLATFPVLLLVQPRRTVRAAIVGLLFAAAALALLVWQTDGGFLQHILLYNINRYSLRLGVLRVLLQATHGTYFVLAIAAVAHLSLQLQSHTSVAEAFAALRIRLTRSEAACVAVIFVLYFAITTAMLISVGKSGATINYFIEWMCVSSVLIGILVARAVAVSADRPLPALCVGAALLLQVAVPTIWGRSSWGDAARTSHLQALVNRIRAASGPVLSDDMVLLMRAGKPVPLEPAIFSELTATGAWDERPFIAMIRARRFAFIITSGYTGETIYDSRHTAEVSSAIETAYPRTEESAGLVVHLPRG